MKKVLSPSSEKRMSKNPWTKPSLRGLSPTRPAVYKIQLAGMHLHTRKGLFRQPTYECKKHSKSQHLSNRLLICLDAHGASTARPLTLSDKSGSDASIENRHCRVVLDS